MAVGRISGPLLKSNLIRNGIDLAFETDLLYLDVNNQRIGVRNSNPQHELDVTGTTRTTDLIVDNVAEIADITINGNTISTDQPFLNLATLDTVVSLNKLQIDSIEIEGNLISSNESNADIDIAPNGTGEVNIESNLNVTGDIFATGNIQADGNITIGDQDTDNVTFNAEVASDIIPDETNTYTLGSDPTQGGAEWADVFTENLIASSISSTALEVDGIDLTLRQGNTFFVAENGNDANSGDHMQDPFASIKFALSQASDGDTVHIFPGEYEEEFPLTISVGVTLKGYGLRSVSVKPTSATASNDAILLNGESTVEDITLKDFFYDSENDTGYGFRFAPGFTVTTRSPYVRNVSVITQGSVTTAEDPRGFNQGDAGKGIFLDGSVATASSRQASGLFNSVTLITPGVDAMTLTNGVRVEWLSSFTYFAKRSIFCFDGTEGFKGTGGLGETGLRVNGLSGTITAGETVEYYDTDGVTLLESATIESVDPDNKFFVLGKQDSFETAAERGGKTITANGDAQLDTNIKQFGSSSLLLDGTGDYASLSSQTDFGFGTVDFTVEGWIYPTQGTGIQLIFDFRTQGTDNAVAILLDELTPRVFVNGVNEIQAVTDATQNAWNHIAYTRSGTTGTLFLNGNSVGTWTDNTDYGTSKPLNIGVRFDGIQQLFQGNIDDVRVINGTAEYTSNFPLPTQRALVTDDTVLMARFDGEDGSTEFEDDVLLAQDIRFSGGATATAFTLTDFTDFGAEVRIISSASVYGDFGIVGDGKGVIVYAIGHNFAYTGNGKEVTNDPTTVIQPNEIVELNGAKIRSVSVDHKGDFRVGDLFLIEQDTGEISFTAANFNLELGQGITFSDGGSETFINGSRIDVGDFRISGNTIETLTGDFNIAADSQEVNIDSNVNIDGDLDVTGNVSIGGNITIGDEETDTIEFVAGIDSDIIPAVDSTYNLGGVSQEWRNLFANVLNIDDITISNNFIETTESNADLELRANGTGTVYVPSNDVEIDQDLTVSGDTSLGDTTITGDFTVEGNVIQTGDYDLTGDLSVGENLSVGAAVQLEEILIDDNFITTTSSNADLELRANGTGILLVPSNDVRFNQTLDVLGDITGSTLTTTGRITADSFTNGNILVDDNFVTTTESNSDLELRANGTGSVVIDDFSINANVITTISDFVIDPGSENVVIDSVGSLKLPVGTSLERPIPQAGQIRFNTDLSRYEGYTGLNWIKLNGVEDVDGDTSITAELTEGANDDTIRFTAGGIEVASVDTTSFNAIRLEIDDIQIDNNTISTISTNSDLVLDPNGTGAVVIDNFEIKNNSITNTVYDSITLFNNVNNGYVKFAGTTGLVLPVGTSAERPPASNSEVGLTRYNAQDQRVEVYDGVNWASVAGSAAGISRADAEDIAVDLVLTLG